MLTLRTLVEELDLRLSSGAEAADAPVRWVHITELTDPTRWLSGGELLLSTGLQLGTPEAQREFVRRLAGHHLAGLGFGTGFEHERIPPALLAEARALDFPVFEVPYELPFIALTETAFARLVNEQYHVLQRSIAIHKRLERLVIEERGLGELVRALSAALGGAVLVLDARGETLAERAFRRELPAEAVELVRSEVRERRDGDATEFGPAHPEIAGRSLALPIAARGREAPEAWLIAVRDAGGLGDFERLILQQAATVVALEQMRQRAMRDTERRLAGDVLAEALGEQRPESVRSGGDRELAGRLAPFGIGERAAVLVFGGVEPGGAEASLERFLRESDVEALVALRGGLLCAVVDASGTGSAPHGDAAGSGELDPVELAARARHRLAERGTELRAAASRVAPVESLRRSFHEARCALEAAALANGSAPEVGSYRDLGAFQLLLSLQDDEALRLYCDSVLGPLENASGGAGDVPAARGTPRGYGDELVRSLEAFIEQNGQWERAARELYCHRHTLRYRIRRVEELTGRDLGSARDRIEFWLALRARELIA